MTRMELIEWAKAHSTGEMISPVAVAVLELASVLQIPEETHQALIRIQRVDRYGGSETELGVYGSTYTNLSTDLAYLGKFLPKIIKELTC